MSDDPFGICCSIAIIACLDVCAGICLDYASIRHGCTETMFKCRCCRGSDKDVVQEDGERAPLIHQTQPAPSEPMVPNNR
ncbi:hypothetical protein BJV77DRAFT_950563 [Russula vinacea]|nr:hypothetical protein BJV77DRAFT_950563 [Russula vinacea]